MFQSKDIGWLIRFFKRPIIGCLKETHFRDKDTQTESEGLGKDIPCKWKRKESWGSNTHVRQSTL